MRLGNAVANLRWNFRHRLDFEVTVGAVALAVLLAFGVAIKIATSYAMHRLEYAKQTAARSELSDLKTMLERFHADYGYYPTTNQGLDALMNYGEIDPGMIHPTEPPAHAPRDPWDRPFKYESDGDSYILKSLGPNGRGTDRDLTITVGP